MRSITSVSTSLPEQSLSGNCMKSEVVSAPVRKPVINTVGYREIITLLMISDENGIKPLPIARRSRQREVDSVRTDMVE